MQKDKNYAFIDAQNLHQSSKNWGWKLDYAKLRKYLRDECGVEIAYLFMGYMQQYSETYLNLQKSGYIIVFREAMEHNGQVYKANCDTDLVLQAMVDFDNYEKAVIVSGDGDFISLMNHLVSRNKLEVLLAPNKGAYSIPLKKASKNNIKYLNTMRTLLVDDEFEANFNRSKPKKNVRPSEHKSQDSLSKKLINKHLSSVEKSTEVKKRKPPEKITITAADPVSITEPEIDVNNTQKVDQSIKDLFKIDLSKNTSEESIKVKPVKKAVSKEITKTKSSTPKKRPVKNSVVKEVTVEKKVSTKTKKPTPTKEVSDTAEKKKPIAKKTVKKSAKAKKPTSKKPVVESVKISLD